MNTHNPIKYCVAVDGSKHSDYAIEIVLTDFIKKGDKLNVVHVKNKKNERLAPYEYEVNKVIDHYFSNNNEHGLEKKDYQSNCLDRSKESKHSLQQIFLYTIQQESDILFVGFKGDKTSDITSSNFPKNYMSLTQSNQFIPSTVTKNRTLSKGISYILQLSEIPLTTIIVKEASKRKHKDSKGFIWCFCIKDMNESYLQFKKILQYVDKSLDLVKGIHIKTESGRFDEKLSKNFLKYCKEVGVKHYNFSYIDQSKEFSHSIGLQISNLINFGDEYIDFVVCHYNNRNYYYIENHPLYDLIMNVECNVVFSKEECTKKRVPTTYLPEENPNLDFDLFRAVSEKLGIAERYSKDEKITFVIDYLKVDKLTIKKKDLLYYLNRKQNGEKTFVDRNKSDEDLILLTEDQHHRETLDTEVMFENEKVKKDDSEIVKEILKQDPPNFSKIKDFTEYARLWKLHEPNLRKIITNIKNNPVSGTEVVTIHNEIGQVLNEKKLFTDGVKDCLTKYVRIVWKKNEAKSYEDIYQEMFDLLPVSNLSSAKNVPQLKKLFEGSHREIIRDLLECPCITITREEMDDLHSKIINEVSNENYPLFKTLKNNLCLYKKAADEQDIDMIIEQWNNLNLIIQLNYLINIKDILLVRDFFQSISQLISDNVVAIKGLNMDENDVNELHDTIIKGLFQHSPYYDEMVELVKIYIEAVINKHVHDILLCKKEFHEFINRIKEIVNNKKKVDFSSLQNKEELYKTWKEDERLLIYISNDIDGLTREELKGFHDEIYKTFACDITSFFEMKKQLSSYSNNLTSGNFKEVKASMESFKNFMKKENSQDEKREAFEESHMEAPNFRLFKDRKTFYDEWIKFVNLSRNQKLIKLEECPLNKIKVDFLNDSIKKHLNNIETDFDWFKILVQNLAMSFYNKDFKTLYNRYNDVHRYKPEPRNM